jgi:peptide-methionine (S)-S-oxide reductase
LTERPRKDNEMDRVAETETAVLGGGCFWCLEAVFKRMDGVESVQSGYAGGTAENPSYEDVCTGSTGHAEVVRIAFDPRRISYSGILDVFFAAHDPTTLNRQGADVGTQYRSIILYGSEEQKRAAEESVKKHQAGHKSRIVTEMKLLSAFYPAEDYHKDYYDTHKTAPYCKVVIAPKLEKLHLV